MFPKEHGTKESRCDLVISNQRAKRTLSSQIVPLLRPAHRRPWLVVHCITIALALVALLFYAVGLWSQNSPYNANQHKALYLFNFAKYTEWPSTAFTNENAPFILSILGKDAFGSDIDIIKEKTIKGRKLVIRYCNSIQEVAGSHLLFICSSETNHLSQILPNVGPGILTVSETEGFIEQNGMINLVSEQKSPATQVVNFEINQEAAKRANLKLDTQLLKLAKRKKNS
jgi:hypothetical protein